MYGVRCAQFIRNDDVTRIIAKFTTRARPDPTGPDRGGPDQTESADFVGDPGTIMSYAADNAQQHRVRRGNAGSATLSAYVRS